MPLIIITGLPCSGKTFRAQQLAADLEALIASDPTTTATAPHSRKTVQIIPSQHAYADKPYETDQEQEQDQQPESLRDQIYNSAAQEKTARAAEFSAIKRAVSKDNIVIADGLNYIKGYRYQLWCEAKAAGTRCCVVHVAAQEDECKNWNRERLRACGRLDNDGDNGVEMRAPGQLGKDVIGDLVPESHTAIYGDRISLSISASRSRSRSSSLDGEEGTETETNKSPASLSLATRRAPRADDTMTLKSLYISDKKQEPESPSNTAGATPSTTTTSQPSTTAAPSLLPSAQLSPPPPTASPPYSPATLVSLAMRYEPPSPFSRWDTPLFTVPSSDPVPPTQAIWTALFPTPAKPTSKKALSQLPQPRSPTQSHSHTDPLEPRKSDAAVKPHAATVLPKATASDALQILETATMDVARHVLARVREELDGDGDGGDVSLSIPTPSPADPDSKYEASVHVPAGLAVSQPMLQRLRRKYTQIQRGAIAHGQGYVHGRRGVVEDFIAFLDREWNDAD